jgi:curved DNA-binding protein CbpA
MTNGPMPDYYEILQVSPRADRDTIERVFRHLAKRCHPDNTESGDAGRFTALMEAFRVLSDPELRARYDVQHDAVSRERWRMFGAEAAAGEGPVADRRLQTAVLSILYKARRNDPDRPGVGIIELERLLNCPQDHMTFHLWYLKEQGWIARLENGTLAITASGVDRCIEAEAQKGDGPQLLKPGSDFPAAAAAAGG